MYKPTEQELSLMQQFEQIANRDNVIGIAYSYKQLVGIGTEYMVKDGEVVAKLYNGVLVRGNISNPGLLSDVDTIVLGG